MRKLLFALKDGPRTHSELRAAIDVRHRQTFRENYLNPAIRADLICAENGLSPHDPRIRYALTDRGTSALNEVAEKVTEKQAIDTGKQAVRSGNQSIDDLLSRIKLTRPTRMNIVKLYSALQTDEVFGRSRVREVTGLANGPAWTLIKSMLTHQLLVIVTGHGKGKYRFRSFDHGDTTK